MLSRANRILTGADFRAAVRRGRKSASRSAVYYLLPGDPGDPARFGFIVSRAVGNAVQRNRMRRRLRSIARELVDAGAAGSDIVVRTLPGSAELAWNELRADLRSAVADRVIA